MVSFLPGAGLEGFVKGTDAIASAKALKEKQEADRELKREELEALYDYRRKDIAAKESATQSKVDIEQAKASKAEAKLIRENEAKLYDISKSNLEPFTGGDQRAVIDGPVVEDEQGATDSYVKQVISPDFLRHFENVVHYESKISGKPPTEQSVRARLAETISASEKARKQKELERQEKTISQKRFVNILNGDVNVSTLAPKLQDQVIKAMNLPPGQAKKVLDAKRVKQLGERTRDNNRAYLSDSFPALSRELLGIGNESLYNTVVDYNSKNKNNNYFRGSLEGKKKIREDGAGHFLKMVEQIFQENKGKPNVLAKLKGDASFMGELRKAKEIVSQKYFENKGIRYTDAHFEEEFKGYFPEVSSNLLTGPQESLLPKKVPVITYPILKGDDSGAIITEGEKSFSHVGNNWSTIQEDFETYPKPVKEAIFRMVKHSTRSNYTEKEKDYTLIAKHLVSTYGGNDVATPYSVAGGLLIGTRLKGYFRVSGAGLFSEVTPVQKQWDHPKQQKSLRNELYKGIQSARSGVSTINNMLGLVQTGIGLNGYRYLQDYPVVGFYSFTSAATTIISNIKDYIVGGDNIKDDVYLRQEKEYRDEDSKILGREHGAAALEMINDVKNDVRNKLKRIEKRKELARKNPNDSRFTFSDEDYDIAQRLELAKVHLAYKMAGVFQGASSGSRTISDADFQIIRQALFAPDTKGTIAKLRELQGLLHMSIVERQNNMDMLPVSRIDRHENDQASLLLKVKSELTKAQISQDGVNVNSDANNAGQNNNNNDNNSVQNKIKQVALLSAPAGELGKEYIRDFRINTKGTNLQNDSRILNLDSNNWSRIAFPIIDNFIYDNKIANTLVERGVIGAFAEAIYSGKERFDMDSNRIYQSVDEETDRENFNLTTYFKLGYFENSPAWNEFIENNLFSGDDNVKEKTIEYLEKRFADSWPKEGKITKGDFYQALLHAAPNTFSDNRKPHEIGWEESLIYMVMESSVDKNKPLVGLLSSAQRMWEEEFKQDGGGPYANIKRLNQNRVILEGMTRFSDNDPSRNRIAVDGEHGGDQYNRITTLLQSIKKLPNNPNLLPEVNRLFDMVNSDFNISSDRYGQGTN
jgi:hypothetical protein|tara:strand:+ start:1807 stop:5097 length:3291 start_codon:yes stop_codon:yes gene_type:complete